MKVSVIIPCYNGEKFIENCVKKVLNQTYRDIEIIIVDDLSKDNSRDIILKLEKKHKQIKSLLCKSNNGPGGAKNEGLKIATGDYITFVDCDDYIDEDYIEKMIEEIKNNKELDLILSGFKKVDENGNLSYIRVYETKENALWQLVPSWGKLYRKQWLIDNDMELPYGHVFEDVLFQSLQIINKPNYALASTQGYNYIYNSKSISHTTMCSFKKDSLKKEQKYFKSIKSKIKTDEDKELLSYFAYRALCWHLLKSGCGVGKKAILEEYNNGFNFLEKEFPNFLKNKYLKIFKKTNERSIIKLAMIFIKILYKLRLSKLFFIIYGKVNLSKIWPNL